MQPNMNDCSAAFTLDGEPNFDLSTALGSGTVKPIIVCSGRHS
jgi:hypothetical protein